MSPGATFERVYHELKAQLGSGRYAAGQHLEPAALSQDLMSSITPVRDALHRLVGEGLADAPRGDGFRTPLVTELGLRHLYRWNAALLDLAARQRGGRPSSIPHPADAADPLARTEHLLLAIAARSGNPEHLAAVARLGERLRPVRRVELDLLADFEAEAAQLAERLAADAAGPLRRALTLYHRRRERLAAEIVAAIHKAA